MKPIIEEPIIIEFSTGEVRDGVLHVQPLQFTLLPQSGRPADTGSGERDIDSWRPGVRSKTPGFGSKSRDLALPDAREGQGPALSVSWSRYVKR